MEPVIWQDSPLAQYLEGEGAADPDDLATNIFPEVEKFPDLPSFAPSAAPIRQRRRPPPLLPLKVPKQRSTVSQIHQRCSSAIHGRLGWSKNLNFLEQFRYSIVASQLLNEHSNPSTYRRSKPPPPQIRPSSKWPHQPTSAPSLLGLSATIALAFTLAMAARWVSQQSAAQWSFSVKIFVACPCFLLVLAAYYAIRHQWLQYIRIRAIENVETLISEAQKFNAASAAAIGIVQDVEIVSRGYSISSPLPPVSRLEDSQQLKRCLRLRRVIRRTLDSIYTPYYQTCEYLQPYAADVDLEKYFDVYEIGRADTEDAQLIASTDHSELVNFQSLQELKLGLQKLHVVRKMLLCTLLALDADGGKADFVTWSVANEAMTSLSQLTSKAVLDLDDVLGEEEELVPPTPKLPLTPGKEKMRGQMRKLGNLSHGIRSLHAKMRLLREESDRALEDSEGVPEAMTNLLAQYDSIGADLKDLVQEWDQGRTTLAMTCARNEHSRSVSCNGILPPRSPTLSLGGSTAVEGSPLALPALQDDRHVPRSRSSTTTSSSAEEIFEAIPAPRPRSMMTREERIAKMKEERLRQAERQDKTRSDTSMLKELETVLKHRPRGRTTGRLTSV